MWLFAGGGHGHELLESARWEGQPSLHEYPRTELPLGEAVAGIDAGVVCNSSKASRGIVCFCGPQQISA